MTSPPGVLDRTLKGSTTPRLFTPPLPEHCDKGLPDGCMCGCGLNSATSWGFSCIDFLENVLHWELLPYQKWLYIHALEKSATGTGFRFRTVVVLIARQNGKTQWLKGLGLWRMYVNPTGKFVPGKPPPAKTVLVTAQGLEYAEATLGEVVDDVKECPVLKSEFRWHRTANGKHAMFLTGKRVWRAMAANRKAGRSLSVDLAEMDELREHHDWLTWDAVAPTTTARENSQVVAASNAGDKRSVVLRSLRDGCLTDIFSRTTSETLTGLFEWSVPDDSDPTEREFWPMANPAMGWLPGWDEDALAAKLEAKRADIAGFKTEHLCQWVDTLAPGILPAEHWEATIDPQSRRAEGAPVWAAVDVNFERSRSYIAIASRRQDGLLHIEIAAAERGTDWIVPWFTTEERVGKFQAVAAQVRGAPVSGLIPDMVKAGIPVLEWGGSDLTKGCGDLFDKVIQRNIRHRPSPALDAAAASTGARPLGDAWVFDRKGSPVDASPLLACAAAAWAESHGLEEPKKVPNIHEWPTEEEIMEWLKDGGE
ncbi:terminase large subunit [Mycobacteroides abscessus]|uniref:terminase large subunit n=1 Tax=Mycobacteroides abscessus TaxID=36809 RepID=UPI001056A260|nr:terminase large subunit [Mycobacteroides abscessus]